MIVIVKLVLVTAELVCLISAGQCQSKFLGNTHLHFSLLPVLKLVSDMTIPGPKKLSDPEMRSELEQAGCVLKKTREGKREILLSTNTAEGTLRYFLGQAIQRRKNLKIYAIGEARISLNGISLCGSELHNI